MILASTAGAEGIAASAQQEASTGEIDGITVYARRLMPATRVAATVTVITDEQIRQTLAGDVKQMVRYEPGLSVSNDPFRFGLDTFTIRGMTGNRVAVDVDGIPSAPGFTVGNYSNSGRAFVDMAFVQRVEVLRGPASSLYGSDAIGGVVAMSTFKPASLLGDGRAAAIRTQAGYDSADDGWYATALAADRYGSTDVLLGYVYRKGSEADTAADVTPDPTSYHSNAALLTAVFGAMPGGPLTVTAEGGTLHQKTDVDAWEQLVGSRFLNTTVLKGDDTLERFRTSVAQQLGSTAAYDTASWILYWQGTDTDQDSLEQRKASMAPPPPAPDCRPSQPGTPPFQYNRQFEFQERAVGAELTAVRSFEAGGIAHDLVYGADLSGLRLEEMRNGMRTDLVTGETCKTILGESFPLRDFPITDVVQGGVFVQDEMQFGGGLWSVIPALRFDYYDLSPKPDRMWRDDNPHTPVVGLSDSAVSPKLGVVRRFGDALNAYFQYSHGFRAPPAEDLNLAIVLPPPVNARAIPNPDLKSEDSDGYELGVRYDAGAFAFTAAGYYSDYDNFIESKVLIAVENGVRVFQSQNVASARIYGTEVGGTVRAGQLVAGLQGWTARFSAAWSRGEDRRSGQPLNSVDPGEALLSVAYDAPSGAWRGELVTTAVAAKREVYDSVPAKPLYRTSSYVTLDLLGQVDLGHGLALNAGIFNLTNRDYIEWADVRGRTADDPLIPYYTNPGRNASLTLHWRY